MTTDARLAPKSSGFAVWFEQFLKSELAPYPGRGVVVARTVIAATITMILIMTFRVYGGALGALYAFLISRENLRSTLRSATAIAISYVAAMAFVLIGADVFADQQSARILWFAISMFVTFFSLRTLRYAGVATGFAVLVVNALPIWQTPQTAEYRVEHTLWQALAVGIGTLVTITVEIIFHALWPRDEIRDGIRERLDAVRTLLSAYASDRPIPIETIDRVASYSIVGTSGLRRELARFGHEPTANDRWSTIISLVGRVVDLGVSSAVRLHDLSIGDQQHLRRLDNLLGEIVGSLDNSENPLDIEEFTDADRVSSSMPQLAEIGRSLSILAQVLHDPARFIRRVAATDGKVNFREDEPVSEQQPFSLFVSDAFRNREHLMFAIRGCVATTLCYLIYELLDWRGIATSVTTCVITALSTVGPSRQKQILRVGGAIAGGLILGIGSQIFILPNIDSITSFALLFAAVTAIGAWIATSSPRLSYFGVQLALAFYLINLQEFTIQTSLTVARDRVIGILLGLFMMWLVFDGIGGTTAADAMMRAFCRNLHALAEMFQQIDSSDLSGATQRIRVLREEIRSDFDEVNAQADGVPFEFGLRRERGMAWRSLIRKWQPRLRTVYFLEAACLQHRLFEGDDALPSSFWTATGVVQRNCAQLLLLMADRLEGTSTIAVPHPVDPGLPLLDEAMSTVMLSPLQLERARGVIDLSRQACGDLVALLGEVLQTPGVSESLERPPVSPRKTARLF
jgi:multidrug resistance protein MdtO